MKVRCINNKAIGSIGARRNLIEGKIYEVTREVPSYYYIVGFHSGYLKERFEVVEDGDIKEDNQLISKLFEEKVRQLHQSNITETQNSNL